MLCLELWDFLGSPRLSLDHDWALYQFSVWICPGNEIVVEHEENIWGGLCFQEGYVCSASLAESSQGEGAFLRLAHLPGAVGRHSNCVVCSLSTVQGSHYYNPVSYWPPLKRIALLWIHGDIKTQPPCNQDRMPVLISAPRPPQGYSWPHSANFSFFILTFKISFGILKAQLSIQNDAWLTFQSLFLEVGSETIFRLIWHIAGTENPVVIL